MRRGSEGEPGFCVERCENLIRHVGSEGESFILYTCLAPDQADGVIAEQTAFFRALGHTVEWKTYAHDAPPDLAARLERAGWEPGDEEALLVFDLEKDSLPQSPPDVIVRRLAKPEEIAVEVELVQNGVWGEEHLPWLADWLRKEMTERPEAISVFVAQLAGETVAGSVGWITYPARGKSFAGLWGGSTLPEQRGRGLYRALVAARLAEAKRPGDVRFVTVDAMPSSRPILERLGFRFLTTTRPLVLSRDKTH